MNSPMRPRALAQSEPNAEAVSQGFELLTMLALLGIVLVCTVGVMIGLRRARQRRARPIQREELEPIDAWDESGRRAATPSVRDLEAQSNDKLDDQHG